MTTWSHCTSLVLPASDFSSYGKNSSDINTWRLMQVFCYRCMISHFSCVLLFVTPWTVACQAPLSMAFSRQEYWSGLPCPPPGDLLYPGIESKTPSLQVDSYHLSHKGSPRILEWVAYPYSRGPSWPRNQTRVSCIAGRFFTSWATWEAAKGNAKTILRLANSLNILLK